MIYGNNNNGYNLSCDICGAKVGRFEEFDQVVDWKVDNWKSEKYKGEWQDVCTECQEG